MAKDGQAPAFFKKTVSKSGLKWFNSGASMKSIMKGLATGVPMRAVALSSMFVILGYMNATKSASVVFMYLVSVTTVLGALNWINILLAYFGMVRAMKAQGVSRETMPYKGPLQPYASYVAFCLIAIIVFFNGKTY
jgi:amino acid transporter